MKRRPVQAEDKISRTRQELQETAPDSGHEPALFRERQAALTAAETEAGQIAELRALILKLRQRALDGQQGKLRVNLAWQSRDDLDLHITDPGGKHIFYNNKKVSCQGYEGVLDRDANAGGVSMPDPQENIFWQEGPPAGEYKISVVHYQQKEKERVPFLVTVISPYGEPVMIPGVILYMDQRPLDVAVMTYDPLSGLKVKPLIAANGLSS